MVSRWSDTPAPRGDDYDARWKALEASGHDPHGEASFVMRYRPRSVLDAGCGTGRVAIELARRGVAVTGVDLDDRMLDAARRKAPELEWVTADLTTVELGRVYDAVVMAGNVMIFLAPGSEADALARVRAHTAAGGLVIAGFQLDRGLDLARYDEHATAAGLVLAERCATWQGDPYTGGDYAVSVHRYRLVL